MAALLYLTNLGDLAVLLPLSAVVLVWLLCRPRWDAAGWWILSVAFCSAVTAILKVYYNACPEILTTVPSGHTSLSVLVYCSIFYLVSERAAHWQKIIMISVGVALAVGIAVSRVLIGAHNITEVVTGMVIGAASLALFMTGFWRSHPAELPSWSLAAPAVLVALLLDGYQLETEEIFHFLGIYLHTAGIFACV